MPPRCLPSGPAKFTVASLFAGAGGSSTGYRMAGGKVLVINEFVKRARDTYAANYPDVPIVPYDIRMLTGEDICKAGGFEKGDIDILDGSPPCSSFSVAGKREKLWGEAKTYSDTKQRTDDLFYEYIRMVNEIQPRVFIAENVKGLTFGVAQDFLGSEKTDLFNQHNNTIFHRLRACGYKVAYKVLDATGYGVPQTRERLFVVGVRNDIPGVPTFPEPFTKAMTLREAFKGIKNTPEELAEVDQRGYAIYKRMQVLAPGEQDKVRFSLIKCHPDKPAPTLVAQSGPGTGSIVHWDNRKFTVPELKAIQSYPLDYKVTGNYMKKAERIGRSVPPLLLKALSAHIYKTILEPARYVASR